MNDRKFVNQFQPQTLFIATVLLRNYGPGAIAGYMAAACGVSVVATLFAPETHKVKL